MKRHDELIGNGTVTGTPRLWLRLEGLCLFILSILLYAHIGGYWWLFLLLLLVPDLSMAGYWFGAQTGARAYNAAHSYVGPAILSGIAVVGLHRAWLPYTLIWAAHIAMDRAMGYGLKYPEAFKNTHLGSLGNRVTA